MDGEGGQAFGSFQEQQNILKERRQSQSRIYMDDIENTRCNFRKRGYLPIENYGMIGNLRTIALCGTDGSIDFFCYPKFDSPSIFLRMLDNTKVSMAQDLLTPCTNADQQGGHFSIKPLQHTSNKQQYLPGSNILTTRFLSDEGVSQITEYMHLPRRSQRLLTKPLLPWLIRQLEVIRGEVRFRVECFPSFDYARAAHSTEFVPLRQREKEAVLYPEDQLPSLVCEKKIVFKSKDLTLDFRWLIKCGEDSCPRIDFKLEEIPDGPKGPGVISEFTLKETQEVIFILREMPRDELNPARVHTEKGGNPVAVTADDIPNAKRGASPEESMNAPNIDPPLTVSLCNAIFSQTANYWQEWISQIKYTGRWREIVYRSALMLKLLTYEPTGAVVASPTFGLPEDIGGNRNWDYRYLWVRDSAFTVYAFMRLGLVEEAKNFMGFMEGRCNDLNEDGSLQIMYSIDGDKKLIEYELDHLEGYRGSRPVRVGNGAYDHLQLDIYGEFMDAVYLYNKYGPPVSYDMWCTCQKLVNYVCDHWDEPDMSIWEVRGMKQNFTYSKVMCWAHLAIIGLRLAEKRMFPCPDRYKWLAVRDDIYLTVMTKCWNPEKKFFCQSYESRDALDSSVLIMPLVFFSSPSDPRLLSTIHQILLPPEKGGLTANNLIFRYNYNTTDDGLGGMEGSFSMCTFWLVEALTRAGKYDKKLLNRALVVFEQMTGYGNHLGLLSEEIARSGELLGNFPQAFTHMSLISAAFNLDRVMQSL
ncbi:hypothetical protein BZG36_00229 [Bifiguratus adelaidae]|uniref:Uncharacterized protein n=1 Tax=Bifiguratus adelaidae TaxID=1938954 RepID=A0A261Y8X7_9FUNG|nr:hypothetical protein BZG36_00229 [Bifiguratus adelaidae]